MTVNPQCESSKALAAAIKGTAPFCGVPVPGHAPVVVDRKRLAGALRGVTPLNIEVIWGEDGRGRSLLIEGVDGYVRTRMRMVCRSWKEWEVQQQMERWTKGERRKQVRAISAPKGADRKAVAEYRKQAALLYKLERELVKLGSPYTLRNPAVPSKGYGYGDYYAETWRMNYSGKRLRTIIGGIAAQARRDNWTNIRLYKELTDHGISFTKLSEMTAKERERRGAISFHSYTRNLHCFCRDTGCYGSYGGLNSIRGEHKQGDGREWGPGRYMAKLADLQTRRSLQNQIDSVKAMMAGQQEMAA